MTPVPMTEGNNGRADSPATGNAVTDKRVELNADMPVVAEAGNDADVETPTAVEIAEDGRGKAERDEPPRAPITDPASDRGADANEVRKVDAEDEFTATAVATAGGSEGDDDKTVDAEEASDEATPVVAEVGTSPVCTSESHKLRGNGTNVEKSTFSEPVPGLICPRQNSRGWVTVPE